MKVQCPISGLRYRSSTLFEGPNEPFIKSPHPIFSLSTHQLLARAKKYKNGNYDQQHLKLLFLAILNKTELITWEVPADPSQNCVLRNLDSAYKVMLWLDQVRGLKTLRLPTYVVSSDSSDLSNIHHFFDALYEVYNSWEAPNLRRLTEDLLASREMRLWKQIHSGGKKTASFYKRLAYWTLDCIGISVVKDPDKREEWAKILQITEPGELFLQDREEVLDIYHHVHREITMPGSIGVGSGWTYSQEILKHLNWMKHILELGPTGYMMEQIGGPNVAYSMKPDTTSEPELEEELLLLEQRVIEEEIPLVEPKRLDYPKSMEYLKAKAAWTRTQTVRDKLHIVRSTIEARKRMAELKERETNRAYQEIQQLKESLNLSSSAE